MIMLFRVCICNTPKFMVTALIQLVCETLIQSDDDDGLDFDVNARLSDGTWSCVVVMME
jgi:hypothetical protein